MDAKKRARKERLVERLKWERERIATGRRKTEYQKLLLGSKLTIIDERTKEREEIVTSEAKALRLALERHDERIAEAERGM
jgi:hypothetical protein